MWQAVLGSCGKQSLASSHVSSSPWPAVLGS